MKIEAQYIHVGDRVQADRVDRGSKDWLNVAEVMSGHLAVYLKYEDDTDVLPRHLHRGFYGFYKYYKNEKIRVAGITDAELTMRMLSS